MLDHDATYCSSSALWPWQMRPIETQFFTGPKDYTRIENLMRATEGNFGFSALAVHCDRRVAFAPTFMLVTIKATPLLGQPFSKC